MNIQTRAWKTQTKLNKEKVQEVLEKLYNHLENGSSLEPQYKNDTLIQLAQTYKYFQPAVPKKCANILDWVGKAKGKEQTRYYLTEMYADKDNIVATDGHRLHLTPNNQGYDGYIDNKGNSIIIDGTYPEYKKVMPEKTHSDVLDMDKLTVGQSGKITVATFNLFDARVTFKMKYLLDLMNGAKTAVIYSESMGNGVSSKGIVCFDSPILFELPNDAQAVLMPMRY